MPMRLRYPELAPEGYAALSGFGHYINTATTLSPVLLGLINLRASLLNGCEFCIGMHSAELRKLHEPETRIDAVAAWAASEAFTPRERAALAWTDTLTQLQTGQHASDEEFTAVSEFFQGKDIVDLSFAIANINAWNRMGVAFRPGWHPQQPKPEAQVSSSEATPSAVDDDGGKVAED
jgi:AhpD family alkylhydroperoxidase